MFTTDLHLAPRLILSRAIIRLPLNAFAVMTGTNLPLPLPLPLYKTTVVDDIQAKRVH